MGFELQHPVAGPRLADWFTALEIWKMRAAIAFP
jgi:hypothetical protein